MPNSSLDAPKAFVQGSTRQAPVNTQTNPGLPPQFSQSPQPQAPAMPTVATPAQAPAPLVNTSAQNANVGEVEKTLMERAKGGMGVKEAMRLAAGQSMDANAMLRKQNAGSASRRGVGGGGAEQLMNKSTDAQTQRDISKQSADIAYKGEQDRNSLLLNTAGLSLSSDASQRGDRQLGLSQWQAQQDAANSARNTQINQFNAEQNAANAQQSLNIRKDDQLLSVLQSPLLSSTPKTGGVRSNLF